MRLRSTNFLNMTIVFFNINYFHSAQIIPYQNVFVVIKANNNEYNII